MSSTKGRRRYSLVVKDLATGIEYLIKFKENDEEKKDFIFKDKAFLTTIDNRTTDFVDENHLLSYLHSKGHIHFSVGEIYITYNEEKQIKTLDVIYEDKSELKDFASKYDTYIDTNDKNFKKIYNNFLTNIKKGRFYRYMVDNQYINSRLISLLEDYLYENRLYREPDIFKELSRYKVMRGYILGKQAYESSAVINENQNVNHNIPIIDPQPKLLHIDSDDEFLNTLTDRDDINTYYDLEDLLGKNIAGEPLFDGLNEISPKTKKLER